MQSAKSVSKVHVEAGERAEMAVANIAKIFDMLATGLYSNVPQSIVREIWSNARDAHVDAGCLDRPFAVTFPSRFNPIFRVRDYGISMSHEQIMGMYTNLGESTKEASDDGVGKFGIGSKSPFAYTDNFTVATYRDGVVRHYSVIKEPFYTVYVEGETVTVDKDAKELEGERQFDKLDLLVNYIPAVYLMGQEKTEEENGVEVQFAIQANDIDDFRRAAHRVSYGFDVKPIVTDTDGTLDASFDGWPEMDVVSEEQNWKLLGKPLEGYRGRAYAKMGCVLYPIDAAPLMDELSPQEQRMLNHTMVLEFPIGALETTPSREGLNYGRSTNTKGAIVRRVRGIIEKMGASTLQKYAEASTYWDACKLFRKHASAGLPEPVVEYLSKNASWGGKRVQSTFNFSFPRKLNAYGYVEVCHLTGSKVTGRLYSFNATPSVKIDPSMIYHIVIEDMDNPVKRAPARLRHWREKTQVRDILWVRYHGGRDAAATLTNFLNLMQAETLSISDMELPPKGQGTRKPVQARLMRYGEFDSRVDLSAEEFEQGGFYFKLERMEVMRPYNYVSPKDAVEALRTAGLIPDGTPIYGAPKSLWSRFEGDGWIEVYPFLKKSAEKMVDPKLYKADLARKIVRGNRFMGFIAEFNDGALGPLIDKAMDYYETMRNLAPVKNAEQMRVLARATGNELSVEGLEHDYISDARDLTDAVKEAYPLLEFLATRSVSNVDLITNYVHTCNIAATSQAATATATGG